MQKNKTKKQNKIVNIMLDITDIIYKYKIIVYLMFVYKLPYYQIVFALDHRQQ